MSEWQPIETAPTKDALYLIHAPSLDEDKPLITTAWFNPNKGEWSLLIPYWINAITHWMPLPEPPDDEWRKGQESLRNVYSRPDPLETMTDEQRMDVFRKYCLSCGSKDPSCVCWNDE